MEGRIFIIFTALAVSLVSGEQCHSCTYNQYAGSHTGSNGNPACLDGGIGPVCATQNAGSSCAEELYDYEVVDLDNGLAVQGSYMRRFCPTVDESLGCGSGSGSGSWTGASDDDKLPAEVKELLANNGIQTGSYSYSLQYCVCEGNLCN